MEKFIGDRDDRQRFHLLGYAEPGPTMSRRHRVSACTLSLTRLEIAHGVQYNRNPRGHQAGRHWQGGWKIGCWRVMIEIEKILRCDFFFSPPTNNKLVTAATREEGTSLN